MGLSGNGQLYREHYPSLFRVLPSGVLRGLIIEKALYSQQGRALRATGRGVIDPVLSHIRKTFGATCVHHCAKEVNLLFWRRICTCSRYLGHRTYGLLNLSEALRNRWRQRLHLRTGAIQPFLRLSCSLYFR